MTDPKGNPGQLDPDAIEEVHRVLAVAVRRICPGWLVEQRDDLVQTAAMRVVRVFRAEEKGVPAPAYLWKVAHSTVMDEIRRRNRKPEINLEQANLAEPGTPPDRHLPGELQSVIRQGIKSLEADRGRAVLLYLHGFSLRDSARMLNWSTKQVDNQRYRGLAELRRYLDDRGYRP